LHYEVYSSWPGFCLRSVFPGSGNPKIPVAFPARMNLISDIPDSRQGTGDHSLTFLTVQVAHADKNSNTVEFEGFACDRNGCQRGYF
jgi:hypothetical protein